MDKDTIELSRDKNHIYGYGLICPSEHESSESLILDKIIEWSQIHKWSQYDEQTGEGHGFLISNKNKKIYKHLIRIEQENISTDRFYKPFNGKNGHNLIPYCDRVIYLDIYWQ